MTKWRTARLEEVAEVLGGGTPSRRETRYFGGPIAWATPTDVTALDSLYIAVTKETITEDGLNASSTRLMPPGAVLLTSRATIGYTAVAQVPICTNQGFVNFICGPDLLPEFLAFWLRTQKEKMIQYAGGTTFKEIARGTLRKFEISLPPLLEQKTIVDILSRSEGIVRLCRQAQRKATEVIPTLFLNIFGDPVTNPKSWPKYSVNELSSVSYGLADKLDSSITAETGVRILTISNILVNGAVDPSVKRFCIATDAQVEKALVKRGDLLFNWRNGSENHIGKTAIWEQDEPVLHVSFLLRLRADRERVLPEFLWATLNRLRASGYYISASRQQINRKFNASELGALKLPVPPVALQGTFSCLVSKARSTEMQLSAATTKAEAIFNGLLAKVFAEKETYFLSDVATKAASAV